jgi:hypothetical protein
MKNLYALETPEEDEARLTFEQFKAFCSWCEFQREGIGEDLS